MKEKQGFDIISKQCDLVTQKNKNYLRKAARQCFKLSFVSKRSYDEIQHYELSKQKLFLSRNN